MVDFTVIIPHRGNALGLWATITSCEEDLLDSSFKYNYVIVANGEDKTSADAHNVVIQLEKAGKLLKFINHTEPMSPPDARQLGAEAADGKYLFFFDNHCLVGRNYFKRALLDFEVYNMDVLHSTTQYYAGMIKAYEYQLKLPYNFWAESGLTPKHDLKPYKCAVGGHGGFAVKASSWNELGGYGPSGLFVGYAGEEVYFDIKAWMHGKTVWVDPRVLHYHFAGDRGYKRHYSDAFYTNLLVCANVIGGEKWMYRVFDSFSTKGKFIKYKTDKSMFDLLVEAESRSKQHAKQLSESRDMDLDTLLQWFRENDIPF